MTFTPTFGSKRHQSLLSPSSGAHSSPPTTPPPHSNPSCLSHHHDPPLILFPSVASAVERGVVWDSVYFLRIAHCGYEYELSYAFLPLLPLAISFLSRTVFAPLVPLIGYRAVLELSGSVINNLTFVFAAIYFYKLSVIILKDSDSALRASILFCFNPAAVFYSAIYSESLYALFSIGGIYHLVTGGNSIAVLLLALSTCARSNRVLISGDLSCICIFTPFIAFQAYGYYNICLGHSIDEVRPWCKARLPLLCKYIQSFLRYFQLKQLPSFLLASPILSLALCLIVYYAKARPEIFFSLGFLASVEEKNSSAVLFSLETVQRSSIACFPDKSSSKIQSQLLNHLTVSCLPFILQLTFMAATAFFFHACAAYILLGSILFSNFYPFT
ncbi:hypothetical protein I3843_13G151700 [Carya illinoinensis]|nr:hypothetical protein I3843_13G151700 [Carya illinoinensis]